MNEREYKIGNLQLQLGSLNDEIKQTITQVNHLHSERDKLLDEMESLSEQRKQVRVEILKARDSLEELLLKIKTESELAVKSYLERKDQIENELSNIQDKLNAKDKELAETHQKYIKAIDNKKTAEEQEIISLTNTAKTIKEEKKAMAKLDKVSSEVKVLLDKLVNTEKEYEESTLLQNQVLKQIQGQESLLRKVISDIANKKQYLSRVEEQLYSADKALQDRTKELRQVNHEYQRLNKDSLLVKENTKKEKELFAKEKLDFKTYKNIEAEKIKQGMITITDIKKEYDRKFKDLKIVESRLRKHFKKQGLQFPAI